MRLVLLTDHPWATIDIERDILTAAGLELTAPSANSDHDDIVALARKSSAILTCWSPVPREMIIDSPELRIIARLGVGVDNIDVSAARERGITVTNVPGYCTEEVSDHVLAMVHAWARGIIAYDREVHAGQWLPLSRGLRRVADLTVGVIGLGQIGRRVAEKFHALGCTVVACDREKAPVLDFVELCDVNQLAERASVVTVHLPLNESTRHFINRGFLDRMKPESLLVNTSRGSVVDTIALVDALNAGRPSGAALDVLEGEPSLPPQLLRLPNVILSPHVAFSSDRSVADVRMRATQEVIRVLSGETPMHPVNR